jgi:cytochrome c biogenesis protein CcmG/thiol:disulfide interchange protein DsbE
MRERLSICLFVVSLGFVLVGLGCGDTAPRLAKGDLVPGFQTTDLNGQALQFPADYRGRIVALRFWAEWCPYCEKEMREIEPIYRDFAPKGLSILALNVGQSRETAQQFIHSLGISYDVGLDESSEIARSYGVLALPTTFIIDRQGRVLRKILGEANAETFRTLVKELLSS